MAEPRRKTWQEFEDLVEDLHRKFHKNAVVKRNDFVLGKLTGTKRQIDVSVRYQLGPSELLIIVECKRHGRRIDVKEMEAFVQKLKDIGGHMGIMVAEKGFTAGAQRLAEHSEVKAYKLRDARQGCWPEGVTFKMFVEVGFLRVVGWNILNEDESPVILEPEEKFHLYDINAPGKELAFDDMIRQVWTRDGEPEGEFTYEVKSISSSHNGNTSAQYRFQVGFRAEVKRFAREASLECLGLSEADGTTHIDAFKLVTQPGKEAVYYSKPDFWKTIEARLAVVIKTSSVIFPGETNKTILANHRLVEMFPTLHIEIGAKSGDKPIALKLRDPKANL